jgi:hypothetical protein
MLLTINTINCGQSEVVAKKSFKINFSKKKKVLSDFFFIYLF